MNHNRIPELLNLPIPKHNFNTKKNDALLSTMKTKRKKRISALALETAFEISKIIWVTTFDRYIFHDERYGFSK